MNQADPHKKQNDKNISKLLNKIEEGNIPHELIIIRVLDMLVELNDKVDILAQKIIHLTDISRKISEIHSLHFPKDALEKEKNLTEKFLAEILLGIPRKRKK